MFSITSLIEEARKDPAKLAQARICGSVFRVTIDSKGRARITQDGVRISLAAASTCLPA